MIQVNRYFSKKILLILIIFIFIIGDGCKKTNTPPIDFPTTDTIAIIPVVPVDTISYIEKLEEDYYSGQGITRRNRDFTFYYDNKNRLTHVGIKNYDQLYFDSATSLLFYSGASAGPYMIISPDYPLSGYGQAISYDTTYFTYNSNDQLISDSSMDNIYNFETYSYVKRPSKRLYTYVDSARTVINWYGVKSLDGPVEITRIDTLDQTNNQLSKLKSFYPNAIYTLSSYTLTEPGKFTNYTNPLSKLNISGSTFLLIYKTNTTEIFGNEYYSGFDMNVIPYYIDFYSIRIPSSFYIGYFNANGNMVPSQGVNYYIEVTPWKKRESYPSQISVIASTSYPGDRFIYSYYYR